MWNWFPIEHLSGLTLRGRDAVAFCQAQFSADFAALPVGQWQVTAWCNPKGRCLSIILAAANEDGVDLILPTQQAGLARQLSLYAIGRQVEFSEALAVEGTHDSKPGDYCLAQDPGRALRLGQCTAPARSSAVLRWRIADLCLPLPWLTAATSARHLPQALGLEHNQGLSYRKGCFPGQEVIARVHYRGRVTHYLLGFELETADDPHLLPGAELLQASGAKAAEVLNCVELDNKTIGLGVSPIDIEPGTRVGLAPDPEPLVGRMVTLDRLCYYQPKDEIINPESSS